jgi:hypothetical protein
MFFMILSAILGLVCLALFVWVVILRFRAAHSRSYFALVGLAAAASTFTMVLMIIFDLPLPWEIVGHFQSPWSAVEFKHVSLDLSAKVLVVISWAAFLCFIAKIHAQWNPGTLSQDQFTRRQENLSRGTVGQLTELVADVVEVLKNRSMRQPPHSHQRGMHSAKVPIWLERRAGFDWRSSVLELVTLSGMPYAFDPDLGHVEAHQVWVGVNRDNNDPVHVFYEDGLVSVENAEIKMAAFSQYANKALAGEYVFLCHSDERAERGAATENGFIHICTDAVLLDGLVNFRDYAADIKFRVTRQGVHRSKETIADMYVDLRCRADDARDTALVHDVLTAWAKESTPHQLALLGDYGMGKSTSCLMFCHRVLSGELDVGRIPILIELRGLAPSALDELEILGVWAAKYNINARALMRLHEAGRLILIFEGFDEMAFSGTRESRLGHFANLWRFNSDNAKILFTGRPNFFIYDEIRDTLGMTVLNQFQPGCRPFRLLPLDAAQTQDALRWVKDEGTRTAIVEKFNNESSFREVADRPLLLFIIASMWKESVEPGREFSDSANIIQRYIEFINTRQDEKRREPGGEVVDPQKFMGLRVGPAPTVVSPVAKSATSHK